MRHDRWILAFALLAACSPAPRDATPVSGRSASPPIVIAHRGASGLLPEHTLEAYDLAITQGADFVEPDLVSTKDGVLVARHENEISGTTDVAERFPDRKRTVTVDGSAVTGWFVEDLTLAELKTLRAKERLATRSHGNDGRFLVPTLDEVLALVRRREREVGRAIGVYPETKHPSYFRSIGLPLEDRLLEVLGRHGFTSRDDAVFIQSFETGNLRALHGRTTIRLIQLIDKGVLPPDLVAARDTRAFSAYVSPASLRDIATYAFGIGVHKELVQPVTVIGTFAPATTLVHDAHEAGLAVHVWTLRSDVVFLPVAYKGDAAAEWRHFAALGVDGMFGDFPATGIEARQAR
jgi:glycerophosphoryl diester phosphodiesterase